MKLSGFYNVEEVAHQTLVSTVVCKPTFAHCFLLESDTSFWRKEGYGGPRCTGTKYGTIKIVRDSVKEHNPR